jgi:hypothetical protein
MAAKLTRLTHKIAIQLHLVAESCTICSSRCRRPVRKLLIYPRTLWLEHYEILSIARLHVGFNIHCLFRRRRQLIFGRGFKLSVQFTVVIDNPFCVRGIWATMRTSQAGGTSLSLSICLFVTAKENVFLLKMGWIE